MSITATLRAYRAGSRQHTADRVANGLTTRRVASGPSHRSKCT
jgi:hypothetical protein